MLGDPGPWCALSGSGHLV